MQQFYWHITCTYFICSVQIPVLSTKNDWKRSSAINVILQDEEETREKMKSEISANGDRITRAAKVCRESNQNVGDPRSPIEKLTRRKVIKSKIVLR